MSEQAGAAIVTVAFCASLILTGVVRKAALERSILDHPNDRSSHVTPTPRGGGLAIFAVVLAVIMWLVAFGHLDPRTAAALGGGGLAVAISGWLDDLRDLPATYRLTVHVGAAMWATSALGGLTTLSTGSGLVELGLLGAPLAVVGLVWSTNLFNFMDGTDGIAAVEAIFVAGIGGALLLWAEARPLALVSFAVAGASLGFLWYNWPPAKIFMGDVGSGFLGFVLAGIALASEIRGYVPLLVWAILAALFIVDATITFARRARHGHWRVAHKSHAYQRLTQAGWSHRRVVISVAILNSVLAALAALAATNDSLTLPTMFVAFGIAIIAYLVVERARPFSAGSNTRGGSF